MTILQNAYKGYLGKKYENEINEFKELALSTINNAEVNLKESLYRHSVISNNKARAQIIAEELLNLVDIKSQLDNSPLEIKNEVFNKEYISSLSREYKKLNDSIVKGESSMVNEDNCGEDWVEGCTSIKPFPDTLTYNITINIDNLNGSQKEVNEVAETILKSLKKMSK